MCETGHNNMTFTTVEQKIAWEYHVGMCDIYRYTDNIDTKITIVIAIVDFIYRYFYAC